MPSHAGIVYLDKPIPEPFGLDALFEAIGESGIQTNGKPIGIVKFLEELCRRIESEWESVCKPYLLRNMTATQYLYSRKFSISPFEADINQKWEDHGSSSPDAPWNNIGSTVCCDVIRDSGASLSRVAWGGRKEVAPRLRLNVWVNGKLYQLFAHRKEYLIEFKCYAHSSKEAFLLKEALNHWFQIRQEVLYELGAQKFFVDLSNSGSFSDKRTHMYGRVLRLYLRLEDWYLGEPAVPITKIGIEWVNIVRGGWPTFGDSEIDPNFTNNP